MVAPYIQAIREHGSAANPFFQLMGIAIQHFESGDATLSMPGRPNMLNGEGWLQGGLFIALADEAMALALYTLLDRTDHAATISETTSFLKGIQAGTIFATGHIIRKRSRIAFLQAEVRDADGDILSRTSATFAIR